MNFSYLTYAHRIWKQLLVIGKTIEREDKKYHIIGMTSDHENNAFLYIVEPFSEPLFSEKRRNRSHRASLKMQQEEDSAYLHCSCLRFEDKIFKTEGGDSGSLRFSTEYYRTIELFFSMINAGWIVPDWLRETDWENLRLTTLRFRNVKRLPKYSPEMPVTITHRPDPKRHIAEKTVTLTVGKKRSFRFTDHSGEEVWCHINKVSLIDVWENTEKQLSDLQYTRKIPEEHLREIKKDFYQTLRQTCSKGMCYIGIEYECSKDYQLQFYTKEYLKAKPEASHGSAAFLLMRLKPDHEIGTHGLPLKGTVIDTTVSPDTVTIPAELFLYYERSPEWEEQV